jgi:TRAP-type C4-dicarboxylate transport system permease small subunit
MYLLIEEDILGMKKIIIILILFVFLLPLVSYAEDVTGIQISSTINNIYRISLGAAALLALLMMILGGYYYMTAAGNAERSGKGTDIIMSSLLGIVILFCAYVLLRTINPDLVNLKLKDFKDYTVPTEQQQP